MPLSDALDRVHESAFLPELWPDTLDLLPPLVNCTFGSILATEGETSVTCIGSASRSDALKRFIDGRWAAQIPSAKRSALPDEPRFVTDLEISTAEQLEQSELQQKFFRPEGLYWSAKTIIKGPFQSRVVFCLRRPYESGPISREEADRMTTWRPELARALVISSRLQFERARSTLDTFQALGLPAAAVSRTGRLTIANESFQALIPLSFQDRASRLKIIDREADSLWRRFVEKGPEQGVTIPVRSALDRGPLLIHIVPIVGNSQDLFGLASWAMVVVPISAPNDTSAPILEGLFDLTPGEARVARALASGLEIETAAAHFGVSTATVRSQLKGIFAKTGTRRQADLAAILSATQTLRSGP